ncbi:hypothetical protein ACFL0M_13865 [Thermodesulfobacteriota bacterium]
MARRILAEPSSVVDNQANIEEIGQGWRGHRKLSLAEQPRLEKICNLVSQPWRESANQSEIAKGYGKCEQKENQAEAPPGKILRTLQGCLKKPDAAAGSVPGQNPGPGKRCQHRGQPGAYVNESSQRKKPAQALAFGRIAQRPP